MTNLRKCFLSLKCNLLNSNHSKKGLLSFFFILIFCLGCAKGGSLINDIENSDSFFLCFPETDSEFSSLNFNLKVELQKRINNEKSKRELNCSDLRTVGAEASLKKINNDEMDSKLGKCEQRSGPCIYK